MLRIRNYKIYILLIFIGILLILNLYKLQLTSSEIDWLNHSKWPEWLRYGLDLFNKNQSRIYDVYLYQRFDPKSNPPFNWPYSINVHEESGIYLKFIYDFYHDLPDKMLFIHANPFQHTLHPFEA
ncbi:unnamed protein product, partial [Rotaria sordida]